MGFLLCSAFLVCCAKLGAQAVGNQPVNLDPAPPKRSASKHTTTQASTLRAHTTLSLTRPCSIQHAMHCLAAALFPLYFCFGSCLCSRPERARARPGGSSALEAGWARAWARSGSPARSRGAKPNALPDRALLRISRRSATRIQKENTDVIPSF